METPLVSLLNDKRARNKKIEDLGFALNAAALVYGLAGVVYGVVLILRTSTDRDDHTHHPTLALGCVIVLMTVVTALVLVAAARVALAVARYRLDLPEPLAPVTALRGPSSSRTSRSER